MKKVTLESFLKKEGIFEAFKSNYERAMEDGEFSSDLEDKVNILPFEEYLEMHATDFRAITKAFYFHPTSEGFDFWQELDGKFSDLQSS